MMMPASAMPELPDISGRTLPAQKIVQTVVLESRPVCLGLTGPTFWVVAQRQLSDFVSCPHGKMSCKYEWA